MDIQSMGAIGEFIGSIAVVISLIYLAMQVRQNTHQTQVANSAAFVEHVHSMLTPLATDKVFCGKWLQAGSNFNELDDLEKQQFIMFEWRAFSTWNHFYQLHKQGLIAEYQWNELLWNFENIGQRGSIKAAWNALKGAYEPDFRSFMDGYICKTGANGT